MQRAEPVRFRVCGRQVKRALEADRSKADCLLVIGTSLQVQPMSNLVGFLPPGVPQILLNLKPVAPLPHLSLGFDVSLLGACDQITSHLAAHLGWADVTAGSHAGGSGGGAISGSIKGEEVFPVEHGDRTWLFGEETGALDESDAAGTTLVEIVSCDFCGEEVTDEGFSCAECFDFDLCAACFAGGNNTHSKHTSHQFRPLRR